MHRLLCALILGTFCAVAPTSGEIVVTGLVTSEAGSPLAAARAELLPIPRSFEAGRRILAGSGEPAPADSVATDAAGRFALTAPRSGVWKVVVTANGFVPMQIAYFPLVEPRELAPVVLRTDLQARIRVVDGRGRPLADARVWADSADPELWRPQEVWLPRFRSGRTGPQGRAVLPRAEGERLRIRVFEAAAILAHRTSGESEVTIPVSAERFSRSVALGAPRPGASPAVLVRAGPLAWPVGLLEAGRSVSFTAPADDSLTLWLETAAGRRQGTEMPAAAGRDAPWTVAPPPSDVFSGRVLDEATRRPLAGALVWAGVDPGAFVHTDAEGRYRLSAPAAGRFWIQAEAAGHRARAVWISPGQVQAGRAPTLGLTPATEIRGRVLDSKGSALPGARLAAFSLRREATSHAAFRLDPAEGRATSGAGGAFAVSGLEPGRDYELRVSRAGHAAVRLQVTAPAAELVVRVAPGRAAFGRVIDDDDRGVEGAEVILTAAGARAPSPGAGQEDAGNRGTSDARGRFTVPQVPAEEVEITVLKEGFAPLRVRGVEIPREGRDSVDLGTFVLAPDAVLAGRVVDPEGEAIADVPIFAVSPKFDPDAFDDPVGDLLSRRPPDARTDADGWFRLSSLSPGDRMHLFAGGIDHVGTWVKHLEVPLAEPLTIVLEPGLRVAGRVVDAGGSPISGAELQLTWEKRLTGLDVPTGRADKLRRSDVEGRFAFGGLRAGEVTLETWAPGFQESDPRTLELRTKEGSAENEDLVIVLERGATVRGEVTTAGGRPLDGVRVSAGRPGTLSDAEGRFRLDGVAPGPTAVKAFHSHYGTLRKEIEAEMGDNWVELVYAEGHEVRGQVVDESGRPLAEAGLELAAEGRPGSPFYRARSRADGSFRIAPVARGEYQLAAELPGWVSERRRTLHVDDEDVEDVRVVLERAALVTGMVFGLDFDDLARVRVGAEDGRGASIRGRLDYTGAYEIRDLPPGDWVVRAVLGGGRRQVQERLEVPPGGAELRRDLRFEERFVLTGTVLLGGEPLPGALVSLTGRELAVEREVASDYQGRFEIEDLEPATYNLGVAHGRELVVANRDVKLDGNRDVVIDLVPARVSGRVVDAASGDPVAGALVALVRLSETGEETNALSAASGEDGAFDFPRAPPGRYRVSVQRDGYAAATWQLDLADGAARRDLELEVRPTAGAEIWLRLASGGVPRSADVTVLDAGGGALLRESRPVEADGRLTLPKVPPGVFQLVIRSPGSAPRRVTLEVPGDALRLVLEPAGLIDVRVPDLVLSDAVATLELLGPDGRPFVSLDPYGMPTAAWRVVGGKARVEGVPGGRWSLRVTALDGQTWEGAVDAVSGAPVSVELR